MASKLATYILGTLYFLLGVALFVAVPKYNSLYEKFYSDWDSAEADLFIKAFHAPGYIWLFVFALFAGIIYVIGAMVPQNKLRKTNIFSVAPI